MLEKTGTTSFAGGKMLASREGGVGFVTFNQPEKRNAMSIEMWQGLAERRQLADRDRRSCYTMRRSRSPAMSPSL